MIKRILLLAGCLVPPFGVLLQIGRQKNPVVITKIKEPALSEWFERCATPAKTYLQYHEFDAAYQNFMQVQSQLLQEPTIWTQENAINLKNKEFQPYTQKLVVTPNTNLFIWGDLHGDLPGFNQSLKQLNSSGMLDNNFKIKPDAYFIFLGDYVDRGTHGAEILYLLMRLKIANPTQVFMARGNHEDITINQRNGFKKEIQKKFPPQSEAIINLMPFFYNSLPVGIFIGCTTTNNSTDYILCCHGALEVGYNPTPFFLDATKRYDRIIKLDSTHNIECIKQIYPEKQLIQGDAIKKYLKELHTKEQLNPDDMSMMWGDFQALPGQTAISAFNYIRGCTITYGENLTAGLFTCYSKPGSWNLQAVIRGHQHHATMPGLHRNKHNCGIYRQPWQVPIFTTVATDSAANTDLMSHCFLKITTAASFATWQLEHQYQDKAGIWHAKNGYLSLWENCDNPVPAN